MEEARFKIKHVSQVGRNWESLPFVAIMVDSGTMACKIAKGMAGIPGVREVRFNFAGSQQGYYYRGGK